MRLFICIFLRSSHLFANKLLLTRIYTKRLKGPAAKGPRKSIHTYIFCINRIFGESRSLDVPLPDTDDVLILTQQNCSYATLVRVTNMPSLCKKEGE